LRRLESPEYDQRKARITNPTFLKEVDLAEIAVLVEWSPGQQADTIELDGIFYQNTRDGVMLAWEVEGDGIRFLACADLWNA
jgi:hypothetical protein